MTTPDYISKPIGFLILFFAWLIMGLLMSPFWLLVTIIGALLGAIDWKEVPGVFWKLFTIQFIWN